MTKKITSKPLFFYVFSFAIPFTIILISLNALHITPFGDNTLVISDANGLYINYLGYVNRLIKGLESITYSFEKGLGGNMMPHISGTMSNPLYAIIVLFSISDYPVAFTWISSLNISMCGLTMYLLLADLFGHKRSNLIFSTSYALSGFLVANVFQIIFFNGPIFLPLMVLGLRKIFQGKSPWLYSVSIALCAFMGAYFAFTLCVASVVTFFALLWVKKDELKGKTIALFANYTIGSLCGGLIPIVTWLPGIMGIMGGRLNQTKITDFSFWEKTPFIQIFSKLFTGSNTTAQLVDGLPNIFVGLLPIALVIMLFLDKNVDTRIKKASSCVLTFYLLGFYIIAFDMLLHGGTTTNWFNFRYSFIFSFFLIVISAYEWRHIDQFSILDIKKTVFIMLVATVLVFSTQHEYVMGIEAILDFGLLGLIYVAYKLYRFKPEFNPKHTFEAVVILVVSLSLCLNYIICTKNILHWGIKESEYKEIVDAVYPLINGIQIADHDFYRMEVAPQRSETLGNDPMLYGYNGVGHGGSNERDFVRQELNKLGIQWYDMRNYYAHGIPAATDALLGIKYVVSDRNLTEEKGYKRLTDVVGMGLADSENAYDSYQSTSNLSIGFVANETINNLTLTYDDVFDNLNCVWQAISGEEMSAFIEEGDISFRSINLSDTNQMDATEARKIIKDYDEKSKKESESSKVAEDDSSILESNTVLSNKTDYVGRNTVDPTLKDSREYGDAKDTDTEEDELITHIIMDTRPEFSSSVEFSFIAKQDGPVYVYHRAALSSFNGSEDPVLKYMGFFHKGDTVTGYLLVEGDYVNRITFEEFAGRFRVAYADINALQKMSTIVKERPVSIEKIIDSHLIGTFYTERNQELLFTIPWDEGWACYVDGQKTELTKVLDVFCAVKVGPGEHTFEMKFEPRGLHIGILISSIACMIFFLFVIFRKIDKAFKH